MENSALRRPPLSHHLCFRLAQLEMSKMFVPTLSKMSTVVVYDFD